MKKLIIIFIAGILSTTLNAQVQKGVILTGGYVSYYGYNYSDKFPGSNYSEFLDYDFKRKIKHATISPQIGFFISETTLFGIGLTYEYSMNDQQTNYSRSYYSNPYNYSSSTFDKDNLILINPYLTKYCKIMDKLYFTATINFLAGIGKEKSHQTSQYDYEDSEYNINGYDELESNIFELRINATPGVTYFISDKWALCGSIGQIYYKHRREKLKTDLDLSKDLTNSRMILAFTLISMDSQLAFNTI